MCSDYLRYSNISASTRWRYDSRLRMDRVTLMDAISHLRTLWSPLPPVQTADVKAGLFFVLFFYLKASSNLRLSHVALAQRNTQRRGFPAVSA